MAEMELSKRLSAAAALVTPGKRIVDIGTDHAYIPIYLVEKKKCLSAVAMDVNVGPLGRAKAHIQEAGFQKEIEARLSDGFERLKPGEADCAVIAGMGGGLVMKILSAYPKVTCSLKECILQPQSEIAKVRAFLLEYGFIFVDEDMVLDDGKYYPMMKVLPPKQMSISGNLAYGLSDNVGMSDRIGKRKADAAGICGWTETEIRYGKFLLEKKHPVLKDFLQREYMIYKRILEEIEDKSGGKIENRKRELEKDLSYIERGLEYYAV